MPTPSHLSLGVAAITLIAAPAIAQDLTGTLRIQGEVMVSTGGEFRAAVDGQPVLPGQRIMVGSSASATVEFSRDCKRTYTSAGVYTVSPALCREDEDRQREEQGRSAEQTGPEIGSLAGSTLSTVVTVLGTAVGIGLAIEEADDDPVSR